MTWNVSDINRRPPPLSEPTRPFLGDSDPLLSRMNWVAARHADRIGCTIDQVFVMLHNAVTPSKRWLA